VACGNDLSAVHTQYGLVCLFEGVRVRGLQERGNRNRQSSTHVAVLISLQH
jgi:hypothetical protein